MNPESERLSDEEIEEVLKSPTTMPSIGATLRGFNNTEDAERVGASVLSFLRYFGTFLNLTRLQAVTIAADYSQALLEIERGIETTQPLTATNDEVGVGVAMSVMVMKDGVPYSHLVLNAEWMWWVGEELEHQNKTRAIHILLHEAAHVDDLLMQDEAMPGHYGSRIKGVREGILFRMIAHCWDEYIASRISALVAGDWTTREFENALISVLEKTDGQTNRALTEYYRQHNDVGTLVSELANIYGPVLRYSAYLLGHVDGLKEELMEAAPKVITTLSNHPFKPMFEQLATVLRGLYDEYGKWHGEGVYEPLKQLAESTLRMAGVVIEDRPNHAAFIWVVKKPNSDN
jgi:hypothetical protein